MGKFGGYAEKTAPVGADLLLLKDSEAGGTKRTTAANLLKLVWPVGSVFLSVVSTSPATLLGFGTWVAMAVGKFLVGVDEGDSDFNTEEETGGAKTKAIGAHAGTAVADHPAHTHNYTQVIDHVHPLATGTTATGNHAQVLGTIDTSSGGTGGTPTQSALATRSGNPVGSAGATGVTANPNSTLTHGVTQPSNHPDLNVLPPYCAVRVWKRVA